MRRMLLVIALIGFVAGPACGGGTTGPSEIQIAGLPSLVATNTTATVSVTGGVGPYTWSVSNPQAGVITAIGTGTSATLVSGATGGTFTVTVRDSTGATAPLALGVGFAMTFTSPGADSFQFTVGTVQAGASAIFTKSFVCGLSTAPCVGTLLPGSYVVHVFDSPSDVNICSVTATVNASGSTLNSTTCSGTDSIGAYRSFQLDASGNVG